MEDQLAALVPGATARGKGGTVGREPASEEGWARAFRGGCTPFIYVPPLISTPPHRTKKAGIVASDFQGCPTQSAHSPTASRDMREPNQTLAHS